MMVYWNKVISYITIPLYRNAVYLILNTAATSLLGFFFWLFVARFYSEKEVGYSSAIISALSFLSIISLLGLNRALVRFLPQTDKPFSLINSSFTLGGIFAIITAGIFVAGLPLWSPAVLFIGENAIFTFVFICSAATSVLSSLTNNILLAGRKTIFILVKDVSISFLKIVLVLGFAAFFRSFGIVSSWGISLGLGFVISTMVFIPRIQAGYKPSPRLDTSLLKRMWIYSGSSYLGSLFASAERYIIPIMVLNLLGTYSNAYFYIAWMMANLLFSISHSIAESLFAESTNFTSNRDLKNNVLLSLKFIYLLIVPVLAILLAASKWLLLAFGTGYAENASMLLWVLSFSALFIGISDVYISVLRSRDRLAEFITIKAVSAIAILTLSYLLLPATGILGVGYIFLGVQGMIAIVLGARLYFFINRLSSEKGYDGN